MRAKDFPIHFSEVSRHSVHIFSSPFKWMGQEVSGYHQAAMELYIDGLDSMHLSPGVRPFLSHERAVTDLVGPTHSLSRSERFLWWGLVGMPLWMPSLPQLLLHLLPCFLADKRKRQREWGGESGSLEHLLFLTFSATLSFSNSLHWGSKKAIFVHGFSEVEEVSLVTASM